MRKGWVAVVSAVAVACGQGRTATTDGQGTPPREDGGGAGAGATEPPAAPCATAWGGPKALAFTVSLARIAVDSACNLTVTGFAGEPAPPELRNDPTAPTTHSILARLSAAGALEQRVRIGSAGANAPIDVVADAAGDRFLAWNSNASKGQATAMVSRFGPDGTVAWQQPLAAGFAHIAGVALDAAGNPHVVGAFPSPLAYAARLDAATGAVSWTRPLFQVAATTSGVAVDAAGNILVSGDTSGALPSNVALGGWDAYVAKLGPDGTLRWVTQLGTADHDNTVGIGVDAAGNAYVGGVTWSTPPGGGGLRDGFLVKLDPEGKQLWTVHLVDPERHVSLRGVAVDPSGSAWLVGEALGTLPGQTTAGGSDVFVAKYDAAGTRLWLRQLGTPGHEGAWRVALDALGNGYVTMTGSAGSFVLKMGPDGNVE